MAVSDQAILERRALTDNASVRDVNADLNHLTVSMLFGTLDSNLNHSAHYWKFSGSRGGDAGSARSSATQWNDPCRIRIVTLTT